MLKHRAGTGIAGRHTTTIDVAVKVIDVLRKLPNTRLTLGIIKKVRSRGMPRIKFFDTLSGFRMKITGNLFVQEFHVITSDRKRAIKLASQAFSAE